MNLTGLAFAAFLAVVLIVYWCLPRRASFQNSVLLAASYLFYLSWSPEWLLLLLTATAVDWTVARLIEGDRRAARARRLLLGVSIAANVGALFWFKYRAFFADSVTQLLTSLGGRVHSFRDLILLMETDDFRRGRRVRFEDFQEHPRPTVNQPSFEDQRVRTFVDLLGDFESVKLQKFRHEQLDGQRNRPKSFQFFVQNGRCATHDVRRVATKEFTNKITEFSKRRAS